jgi:hypothetical protein
MSHSKIISCALLAASACADSAPADSDHGIAARIVGLGLAPGDGSGWVTAFGDTIALALGGMPAGLSSYEDVMTIGQRGAGTHTYMVICHDQAQAPVSCSYRVARADVYTWFSLPIERGGEDLAIHFQGSWSLDGMQKPMPTLTGTSSLELAGTIDGTPYDLVADVEHDLAFRHGEWMMTLGGTSRLGLRGRAGSGEPLGGTVEITYNGWETADILVGGLDRYRIDLKTGELCGEAELGRVGCPAP